MPDIYIPNFALSSKERTARINIIASLAYMFSDLQKRSLKETWEHGFMMESIIDAVNLSIDASLPGDESARTEIWNRVAEDIKQDGHGLI